MSIIKCQDQNLYPFKLKKFGRVKKIFFGKYGPYYKRGNMNVLLDCVEKLSYSYFYRDEQGKDGYISGYEYNGPFSPFYVEILADCESVQLWEEA